MASISTSIVERPSQCLLATLAGDGNDGGEGHHHITTVSGNLGN